VRTAIEVAALNDRNPIMPLDGPKSISAKFGKTKVQTIKILQPTSDKPPLTSHTQKNHAVKQKSKLARHNKSNEAA
jgi:hypothetical protein